MAKSNKFGFETIDPSETVRRARSVGPMGAAVREAAESLTESTEAKVEQRRLNAKDAKAWRQAEQEGRVLISLPLDEIKTTDLPRDRIDLDMVAQSDEMEELKASISVRGQKEPIEIYHDADGNYQLKKGWRRLTALRQLRDASSGRQFNEVLARIDHRQEQRIDHYVDMVEENVVREDLSFAEMAQVAIEAAKDPNIESNDADALVGQLYGSLHKMKRSYIRSFVYLLSELDGSLTWPKAVSRNLGVDVARQLRAGRNKADLEAGLGRCASAEEEQGVLMAFVANDGSQGPEGRAPAKPKSKYEFHVGQAKVTARDGECRILSDQDFAAVPRALLERAIVAFEDVLKKG